MTTVKTNVVITVSGKGGVGKTTITALMVKLLSLRKWRKLNFFNKEEEKAESYLNDI